MLVNRAYHVLSDEVMRFELDDLIKYGVAHARELHEGRQVPLVVSLLLGLTLLSILVHMARASYYNYLMENVRSNRIYIDALAKYRESVGLGARKLQQLRDAGENVDALLAKSADDFERGSNIQFYSGAKKPELHELWIIQVCLKVMSSLSWGASLL